MSAARVAVIQQMKESELRYLKAMKAYLAEQKELREKLLALEGAQAEEDAASEAAEVEREQGAMIAEEKKRAEQADEEKKTEEKKKREAEEKKKRDEGEKKAKEEKKREEEEAKKRKEEEEKRKKEDEKRKKEEEKRRKEVEEKKKKDEEKRRKEEEKRKKEEAEEAQRQAEEAAAAEEAERQQAAEAEEAQRKLEAETEQCDACEERNPIGFTFCDQCGSARAKSLGTSPPPVRTPVSPAPVKAVAAATAASPAAASPVPSRLAAAAAPAAGTTSPSVSRGRTNTAAASPVRRAVAPGGSQEQAFERLQRKAAAEPTTATEASNKDFNKTPKAAVDAAAANDPNFSVLDLSGNTVFSMKKKEYCEMLAEALKVRMGVFWFVVCFCLTFFLLQTNTHITQVRLAKCTLDAQDAKQIGSGLAVNDSIELLDLSQNKINNDGAKAIALALRTNTRLTELNLLGQPSAFGDSCLEDFVALFDYNVTLTKIIWRLDSRKSFAINKLLVRNNTIAKWLSEGKDVSSLIPDKCHIPELAGLAQKEIQKARASSSAPRLEKPTAKAAAPAAKEDEADAINDQLEEGEGEPQETLEEEEGAVAAAEAAEVEEGICANDAWWVIDETPNGLVEDEGRSLSHTGGEAGGKACIALGTVAFSSGNLEFTVVTAFVFCASFPSSPDTSRSATRARLRCWWA